LNEIAPTALSGKDFKEVVVVEAHEPAKAAAPVLEIVSLEMLLQTADLVGDGFEASLTKALEQLDGVILFNVRLDEDPHYQRVAGLRLFGEEETHIALALLPNGGRNIVVQEARLSDHPLARIALAEADSPQLAEPEAPKSAGNLIARYWTRVISAAAE
jgi:hypothetical protein